MNNLLTLEEVKSFLSIDDKQIEKYLRHRKLNAYKIGGVYLRFRKDEVLNLRMELLPQKLKTPERGGFFWRLYDFWRFNNFYIVSLLIVIALAFFIVRT